MKRLQVAKAGYISVSIATLLFGFVLIGFPELSVSTICMIMGIIILLSGATKLFGYFTNDLYRLAFQFDFALGILTMLLGLLFILIPAQIEQILVMAIAIYVIVNGLFSIQTAVEARQFGLKNGCWWSVPYLLY